MEWTEKGKTQVHCVTYDLLLVYQFDVCAYIYGIETTTVLATKVIVVIQLQYTGLVKKFWIY